MNPKPPAEPEAWNTSASPTTQGMPHPSVIVAHADQHALQPAASGLDRHQVITSPALSLDPMDSMAPATQPDLMAQIDIKPVEKLLVEWAKEQLEYAKTQTEPLRKRCDSALKTLRRSSRTVTQSRAKEALGQTLYDSEAADQVDAETGLLKDLILRDGKLAKIEAGPSDRPERAMVLEMALDYILEVNDAEDETEQALHGYALYPYSGYKLSPTAKGKFPFKIQSVNPFRLAFSDTGRSIQEQYSIHEAHFFTLREMKRSGFKNLDKIGSPDGMGRNQMSGVGSSTTNPLNANSEKPKVNDTHECYESWGEPPWMEWVEDKKITEPQLNKFAIEYGFHPQDIKEEGELHCVIHKGDALLKWYPNYLLDKDEMPYWIASHYPAENSVAGEGQMERSSDAHNAKHIILNHWMDNMRMQGNQSMFYSTRASVNPEMLQRLFEPRGKVPVAGNDDLDQMFKFFTPPNLGPELMTGLQYWQSRVESSGINDAMRGFSSSRTATENNNNNARGQSQINNAGSRFVRQALFPALRSLTHCIVAYYDQHDWYAIAGEDGEAMIAEPWMVEPADIDRHFRVLPVASFDFQTSAIKIQEISNLVNSMGMFIAPEEGRAAFHVSLRHSSLKKHEIDEITGALGSATDALEEITAMIENPWTRPEVNMNDDHQTAIMTLTAAVRANPALMQQDNVRDYWMRHQMFYNQQQMMLQQQAMMQKSQSTQGGRRAPQIPKGGGPTDPEGQARQQGQLISPPDQQALPGATGMGAML